MEEHPESLLHTPLVCLTLAAPFLACPTQHALKTAPAASAAETSTSLAHPPQQLPAHLPAPQPAGHAASMDNLVNRLLHEIDVRTGAMPSPPHPGLPVVPQAGFGAGSSPPARPAAAAPHPYLPGSPMSPPPFSPPPYSAAITSAYKAVHPAAGLQRMPAGLQGGAAAHAASYPAQIGSQHAPASPAPLPADLAGWSGTSPGPGLAPSSLRERLDAEFRDAQRSPLPGLPPLAAAQGQGQQGLGTSPYTGASADRAWAGGGLTASSPTRSSRWSSPPYVDSHAAYRVTPHQHQLTPVGGGLGTLNAELSLMHSGSSWAGPVQVLGNQLEFVTTMPVAVTVSPTHTPRA